VILVLALLFTAGCVGASGRRLFYVVGATPIDAASLATSLRRDKNKLQPHALALIASVLGKTIGMEWERDVVVALSQPVADRPALLGEAMTELDFRARRWFRVPRVSASLSSSFGFLLATLALRVGLSDLVGTLDAPRIFSVDAAVFDAVDVAAVGLVGAAFCIAFQYRSRVALAARLSGVDRLVEVLEGLDDGAALVQVVGRGSVPDLDAGEALQPPLV
jgi:hypothetical protein